MIKWVAALFAFIAPLCQAQKLNEVWMKAKENDRKIQIRSVQTEVLRARSSQESMARLPSVVGSLGLKKSNEVRSGISDFSSESVYGKLTFRHSLIDREKAFKAKDIDLAIKSSEAEEETYMNIRRYEIIVAYLGLIQEQRKLHYRESVLKNPNEIEDNLEALERAGVISRENLNFLIARLSTVRVKSQNSHDVAAMLSATLKEAAGIRDLKLCTEQLKGLNLDERLDINEEDPAIRAISLGVDRAEQRKKLEQNRYLPTLDLFAERVWTQGLKSNRESVGKWGRVDSLGLTMNWSLTDALTRSSAVREADANLLLARLEKESAETAKMHIIERLMEKNDALKKRLREATSLSQKADKLLGALSVEQSMGTETRLNIISNTLSALEILWETLDDEFNVYRSHLEYRLETGNLADQDIMIFSQRLCA